jgi:hypothetical protein
MPRVAVRTGFLASALVPLGLALAACPGRLKPPEIECTPTVAGVVTVVDHEPFGEEIYTLQDGTEVHVAQGRVTAHFGPAPTVGDLLMYGESEECGPFLAVAAPRDIPEYPGCLGIGDVGLDDGAHVLLNSGLRLPKAEGFETQASYRGQRGGLFCLNEQGEVVFFREG